MRMQMAVCFGEPWKRPLSSSGHLLGSYDDDDDEFKECSNKIKNIIAGGPRLGEVVNLL